MPRAVAAARVMLHIQSRATTATGRPTGELIDEMSNNDEADLSMKQILSYFVSSGCVMSHAQSHNPTRRGLRRGSSSRGHSSGRPRRSAFRARTRERVGGHGGPRREPRGVHRGFPLRPRRAHPRSRASPVPVLPTRGVGATGAVTPRGEAPGRAIGNPSRHRQPRRRPRHEPRPRERHPGTRANTRAGRSPKSSPRTRALFPRARVRPRDGSYTAPRVSIRRLGPQSTDTPPVP